MTRKGFSFGYRKELPQIDITPGPGDYDLNQSFLSLEKKVEKIKILSSFRFPPNSSPSPGPGYYSLVTTSSGLNLPTISKSKRSKRCFYINEENPGPGVYELSYDLLKKMKKLPKNGNQLKYQNHEYDGNAAARNNIEQEHMDKILLEGSYERGEQYLKSGMNTYKEKKDFKNFENFENKNSKNSKNSNFKNNDNNGNDFPSISNQDDTDAFVSPGPGHYEIPDNLFKQNTVLKLIKPKTKFKIPGFIPASETPSPNYYSKTDSSFVGPKYSFGQRGLHKSNVFSHPTPGPGQYQLGSSSSFLSYSNLHPSSFSKSNRLNFLKTNISPGPGNYNIHKPEPFMKETGFARFGDSEKIASYSVFNRNPGPGAYYHEKDGRIKKIGYSISGEIKKEERKKQRNNSHEGHMNFSKLFENKISVLKNSPSSKLYNQMDLGMLSPKTGGGNNLKSLVRNSCTSEIPENEFADKKERKSKLSFLRTNQKSVMKDSILIDDFNHKTKSISNNSSMEKSLFVSKNLNNLNESSLDKSNMEKSTLKKKTSFSYRNKAKKATFMGTSIRKLEFLDTGSMSVGPGPANYDYKLKGSRKLMRMATSKRDDRFFILDRNPGAGSYETLKSSFQKERKDKKKKNPSLIRLLNRIQMKAHPEKNKKKGNSILKMK